MESARGKARQIADEFLRKGDPTGWFEVLYALSAGDEQLIPWADMAPNPGLVAWVAQNHIRGDGKKALVIGCGLGDDAEELARAGFDVMAFDISKTAINWCKKRFDQSKVQYGVADLFASPASWVSAFDFVLESCTLQVLPETLRPQAIEHIAGYVAAGGMLLVICRGRDESDDPGSMPWPLTREDLMLFCDVGLQEIRFEDYMDQEQPPVRRFRVEYRA